MIKTKFAFTLSEVLITLGTIGIIAAITLPTIINNINDMHYKVAYKKAYNDLSQVLLQAKNNDDWPCRPEQFNEAATIAEFAAIKKYMKVAKECTKEQFYSCWADGDMVNVINGGYPQKNQPGPGLTFIDTAGRSWATHYLEEIYSVDTNGLKGPNIYGKDRFVFYFAGRCYPKKVATFDDKKSYDNWCPHPPCYYKSWLQY